MAIFCENDIKTANDEENAKKWQAFYGHINSAYEVFFQMNFTFQHWRGWQGVAGYLLSDENAKKLRSFPTVDDCINWLFSNGFKEAARKLNELKKVKQ